MHVENSYLHLLESETSAMPIQEIPLELDHLLKKGDVAYWQAGNNRKSVTQLSPWARKILGPKADSLTEEDNWFDQVHPNDLKEFTNAVKNNDGTDCYQVDYRWSDSEDSHIWLRELGRRKSTDSDEYEGLLFPLAEQKELEHRALNISEREKRKLGRELHDDLCQQLAGMLFFTNNLVHQIKAGKDMDTLLEATTEIKQQLQLSIEKTRCLSHGLNPVNLEHKNFEECFIELIQQTQTLYSIDCQFQMSADLTIQNQELATHLFRITQESINNAVRHGNANTISIALQKEGDFGILTIRDNGTGFKSGPQNTDGMGLHNLRSRARMINATIEIGNSPQGGGVGSLQICPQSNRTMSAASQSKGRMINIFLVDDHPLIRKGLSQLLGQEEDMQICGEAEDVASALKGIPQTGPDLVIADISLRGNNGLELIKNIKALYPHLKVLVFSMHDEVVYAQRALRAGARAYVMKQEDAEKIKAAIRRIMEGDIYVSQRVSDQLLHQIVNGTASSTQSPVDRLSDRELEVVQSIGNGLSTREIAEALNVSVKTIESHRAHIKEKLNLKNATELVQFSVQWVEHENSKMH